MKLVFYMFFASLFGVIIESKNGRVFVNFFLFIRIIPVGGYTYNSLYLARKYACILVGYNLFQDANSFPRVKLRGYSV